MRPLELHVEGIASFRTAQTISFRDLDLFAITGPTGSGKSSIIDAMVFALYGRVPRLTGSGPGNPIRDVIAQGLDRASVQLVFAVGEREYRVLRQVKKTGPAVAHLEECDTASEAWIGQAEGVTQVNARVQTLVGMDFDSFTRTVLLPQGQFQRFLAGDPRERHGILRDLLNLGIYERVMQLARRRADEQRARLLHIDRLLSTTYADATPERKREAEAELARFKAGRANLEQRVADLDAAVHKARDMEAHQRQAAECEQLAAQAQHKLAELQARLGEALERVQKSETRLQELERERGTVEFDPPRFQRWTAAQGYLVQVEELGRRLEEDDAALGELEARLSRGQTMLGEAESEAETTETALRAAEERYHAEQARDMAQALRQDLAIGDPCPVCGQPIESLPDGEAPDLDRERRAVENARGARRAAEERLGKVQVALGKVQAQQASVAERRERNQAALDSVRQSALAELGESELPGLEQLRAFLAAQRQAQQRLRELEEQERRFRQRVDEDRRLLATAQTDKGWLDGEISALQRRRQAAETSARAIWSELTELALVRGWVADRAALADLRDVAALRRWCESLQQQARADLADTLRAIGDKEGLVQRLEVAIQEAEKFRREMHELQGKAEVAAKLGQLLQANQLPAFIEHRALQVLARDGSLHLDNLSQGRYTLEVNDRGFQVVDRWHADQPRSVHTLSGGETFLASLALAVGLAEGLPRWSASADASTVLESLFVDEGFGSLDAETLDVAASGLEQLFVGRSMVAVITHVEALAERLPVQLEVVKSQAGSTVRLRDQDPSATIQAAVLAAAD